MYDHENEHLLLNHLLMFINTVKQDTPEISMTDIILEFANDKDVDIGIVSEAIANDVYFKKILLNDCISKNIIKQENQAEKLDDW